MDKCGWRFSFGKSLTKTAAGTAWSNAGAASNQTLLSGDGYLEFTATETNTDRICGLSQMEGSISLQGAPALPFTGSRNS